MTKKEQCLRGLKDGLPICLGYFSVSIAFGMMAIACGRPLLEAVLISLTNLTSAGQFAGLQIIAGRGGLFELFLSTLIINARYFLMSLSVSQKLSSKTTWTQKLLIAFGITDEIFAVSMSNPGAITFWYMVGVIVISTIGWVSGTFVGGMMSQLLPASVSGALGIMLYGMFIAIIVPACKKEKNVLIACLLAIGLSILCTWFPILSSGWSVIVITVCVSGVMASIWPIDQKERDFEDGMERDPRDGSDDVRDPRESVSAVQTQDRK